MNKKVMMVTVLCGLIGSAELSAFTPGLYFTSGRMAGRTVLKGLANSVPKGKYDKPVVEKVTKTLVKKAAGLVGAQATKVAPSMITSVPAVAAVVLPKTLPSAAQVYTTLTAQQETFMRLAQAAYRPVAQAVPKIAPVATIAQAAKSSVMTPLKKALAAGCATAAAGMGYVGSLFARTKPLAPSVFQAAFNRMSQHKMVATGVAVATLTTAYCARYKINPVTKMKKYFGSPRTSLITFTKV